MENKIETILAAARAHCEEDIIPNVDDWNKAGV